MRQERAYENVGGKNRNTEHLTAENGFPVGLQFQMIDLSLALSNHPKACGVQSRPVNNGASLFPQNTTLASSFAFSI